MLNSVAYVYSTINNLVLGQCFVICLYERKTSAGKCRKVPTKCAVRFSHKVGQMYNIYSSGSAFTDSLFRAYQFKLEEVEAFRYRAKDAWKAVTRIAVREARLKEIKQEIFNCQKLKVN